MRLFLNDIELMNAMAVLLVFFVSECLTEKRAQNTKQQHGILFHAVSISIMMYIFTPCLASVFHRRAHKTTNHFRFRASLFVGWLNTFMLLLLVFVALGQLETIFLFAFVSLLWCAIVKHEIHRVEMAA